MSRFYLSANKTANKPNLQRRGGAMLKFYRSPNKPNLQRREGAMSKFYLSANKPNLQRRGGAMSSNSKLPEELYYEILLRLPAKSVLKCKSVCKSWFSLISNPNFAKSHFQQHENKTSSSLLLGLGNDIYTIGYDALVSSSLTSKEIKDSALRMPYPFRLFGSCNGLVFLWLFDDSNYDYNYGGGEDFLCVWNPATGEYKKIPSSPNTYCFYYSHYDICISGLAYDSKNDDYKFVIGVCSDESGLATLVEVFSLKSNSWQTIETPYGFTYYKWKPGVLVNGDLHWFAEGECDVCIVYLDMSYHTLSFKEIQLPTVPNLEFINVGVLEEGCLCVVADNGDSVGLGRFQVWEMKLYGVRESWTKRYVITNETITASVMFKASGWKTIWSFKNKRVVFLDSRKVVLYDPNKGTAISGETNLDPIEYITSEVDYVETLVSLSSGTYVWIERT